MRTAASQHVWQRPLRGLMGRRWLGQRCAGKMMVCLDRRNAEATFLATVVMPDSGACPTLPGTKALFCESLPLVQTSAFPRGSFQPERSFCAGCPIGELFIPNLANADALGVCWQQCSFPAYEISRLGRGWLLRNYKTVSVPCGYNNVLILVKQCT